MDFLGEVERSLTVLDGAVLVLSAVEGVQAQTRLLWRALEKMGIPTLLVVNKVDRTGCDIPGVLEQLRQECTTRLLPAQQVEEAGSDSCQVLPLESFWEDALAWAADYDQELAEAYLEERPVPRERLLQALREGVAQRQVFPVLFASAKGGKGMEALLEGVVTLLPPCRRPGGRGALRGGVPGRPRPRHGQSGPSAGVLRDAGEPGQRPPSPRGRHPENHPDTAGFTGRKRWTWAGWAPGKWAQCTGSPLCGPGTCWGRRRPGPPASWTLR